MKNKFKFITLAFISLILIGCKTLPDANLTVVDPLDLLDTKSTFYIAVPKSVDPELITKLIKSNMRGVSDSDVNQICSRVNKVYAGLNKLRKTTEIQAAIDSDIPVKYIPKILTKKNGWKITDYLPKNGNSEYPIYSQSGLNLSFPSDSITCLGRNPEEMLDQYDSIHYIPSEESLGKRYNKIDDDLYDWLKYAEDEIRFYANQPASYLTILTGASLDLKLIDVKGSFKVDPAYKDQYLLNLDFNFKSSAALKLGRSLLGLAFGLTNSNIYMPTDTELVIQNIHISKNQLYKLFIQAN